MRKSSKPTAAPLEQTPPATLREKPEFDLTHTLEDLQVHQIELAAQNRQLREMRHDLEESRDRYADLYDFAPVGYMTVDGSGIIQDLNLTGASMLADRRSALAGMPFTRFIPAWAARIYLHQVDECLKLGKSGVLETALWPRDGRELTVQLSTSPFRSDPNLARTTITDVTELTLIKQALSASEARNLAMLTTATDAIVTLGEDDTIYSMNASAEAMFGYREGELIGRPAVDLFIDPSAVHEINLTNTALEQCGPLYGRRQDGDRFPVEVLRGNIATDGRKISLLMIRDIGFRRRLEMEVLAIGEQVRRDIGQDLHDSLSQELAGISFLAGVLQRNLITLERPEAAEAERIHELVQQCLAKSRRLIRGLYPTLLEEKGLIAALRDMVESTQSLYAIPCTFRHNRGLRIPMPNVAINLYRIAQEAINNAIRHAQPRHIALNLQRFGQDSIQLCIKDDGRGLPSPTVSEGMGLRIMRHRANVIGGTLEIRPNPGGGTSVVCTFSIKSAQSIP